MVLKVEDSGGESADVNREMRAQIYSRGLYQLLR